MRGYRAVATAARIAVPGTRLAMPSIRRDEWPIDSRINATESIDSGAGAAGVSSGSSASAVRSTRSASSAMPPTPSVTAWCTFMANGRALGAVGVVETFDQGEFPQRPGAVEAGRRHRLQRVEERALGSRRGQAHTAEVEVEVEGRLDRPARRPEAERRGHDVLAKARNETRGAFDARAQAVEVGRPVEERDRDDGRPQDGILLDEPHERVLVAHVAREARIVGHRPNGSPRARLPARVGCAFPGREG